MKANETATIAAILDNVLTALRVDSGYASPEELRAWHTSTPCEQGWDPRQWGEHRVRTLMLGLLAGAQPDQS